MNSKFNYRAWHNALGVMLNVYVISQRKQSGIEYIKECRGWYGDNIQVEFAFDEVEWMQCIGISDKTGKDVYHSDIVKDGKGIGVIYYYAPAFVVQCLPDEVTTDGVYSLAKGNVNVSQLVETEVIGNIYENPELLNL